MQNILSVNMRMQEFTCRFLNDLQRKRTFFICLAGMVLALLAGCMLYYTMKRINRPVSQISHELRTPLTGIRGYAEYLMLGNLTEEDRFYAAGEIVDSAVNLEEIVEKLLIMGNVKEGRVEIKTIKLAPIFENLQEKYPKIKIHCQLETIKADHVLFSCLIENLTANAVRAGDTVKLILDARGICVWNDGEVLDDKTLRKMNGKGGGFYGGNYKQESIDKSHGYGIELCREIAGVHGWKLVYSVVDGGIAATIRDVGK